MKNEKKIEAIDIVIEMLQNKKAKLEQEDAMSFGRPFPVPPSGCPEGYYESGGQCILDS